MKRIIFIVLGCLALVLGIIGIILPVLPTTPFLLLASYLFMKSSSKLYNILLNNRYLGPYIKNYLEKKGIPRKAKITAIIILWVSIIISGTLLIDKSFIRLGLIIIAVLVSIIIIKQKSLTIN